MRKISFSSSHRTRAAIVVTALSIPFLNAAPFATAAPAGEVATKAISQPIGDMKMPFLFAYGSWDKKVRIENGRAILSGEGLDGKGGAGVNFQWDASAASDSTPALRLKVGAANKVSTLTLRLSDQAENGATWQFALPPAGTDFVVVAAKDGASLARPNALDKPDKTLDLTRISQWQLIGDWSAGPLDVEVESIFALAPDADIQQLRAQSQQKEAAAREQQRAANEALATRFKPGAPASPQVVATGLVASDVLSITIQAGRVELGKLAPYVAQAGDEKRAGDHKTILVRGGQEIGWLIGPHQEHLVSYEKLIGDPLVEFVADNTSTYSISSPDDAAYAQAVPPAQVFRKSKPTDWSQPAHDFAMRHIIYLKLPRALHSGKTYTLSLGTLNVQKPTIRFVNEPSKVLCEAIHINQIGYRPDDPLKRAYLSLWMGSGGALHYPAGLNFSVVEDATGKAVLGGKVELAHRAEQPELMWRDADYYTKTDVYRMDFGALKTPGRYRVCVAGIGCSLPFTIGAEVWKAAFTTQMKGLYHQRSGIALKPPYSDFIKPRDFHPADGAPVFQSTVSILDEKNDGAALKAGSTGQTVPEAWGGYHDAGDWNPRRVTHLRVTMAQLEVMELFPKYFSALKLNIPPTAKVPDVLSEALFEIDCFRRLQMPDGGVRFGIETEGDPYDGEVSYLQSMPAYVYAPDLWSSYIYAAVAARAAKLLAPTNPSLSKTYRDSALKAINWAEADWAKRRAAGTLNKLRGEVKSDRALASVIVYDLTDDPKWHAAFQESCAFKDNAAIGSLPPGDRTQYDAAFAYARLSAAKTDATIRKNALRIIETAAGRALTYAQGNGFNLTTPDKGKPMFIGYYSTPDATELVRAHFLTHDAKYLAGALQACHFSGGANPSNMTYTTGIGINDPKHPLHLDSRRIGQKAPRGLTVYGNFDFIGWPDQQWATWPLDYYLDKSCTPPARQWPISEAYWDIYMYPAINEWTVDAWAPNVYVWGYLAARP